MSHTPHGTTRPVTRGRRFVAEVLRQSRHVPLVTARHEFAVPRVAAIRARMNPAISWVALFARAYALAAREHERLRRSWMTFPVARLYEHPVSACQVLVEREWEGDEVVLGGKIHAPEEMSLADIDRYIRRFRTAPVSSISCFRQTLRIGLYPGLLRRFVLWSSLHWSGFKRSKRFGTFLVSSLGNLGCETVAPTMPLTGYLNFGPIFADGRMSVGLIFDHRVMDGRYAARAQIDMERILNTSLLTELKTVAAARPTASWREDSTGAPILRTVPVG